MTQQEAALEVLIRMQNRVELRAIPSAVLLDLLDLVAVLVLKHAVARNMVPLPLYIVAHLVERLPVVHTRLLEQTNQVVWRESAVGAAVRLARSWQRFRRQLLTRVRRVALATPVGVASYIAVGVANVVAVLLVELLVGDELEAAPPEYETFFQVEADAFEEECVLQTSKMFEVRVLPQRAVKVLHTKGEMLTQGVDRGSSGRGETIKSAVIRVGRLGGCKARAQMRENG